MYNPGRVQKLAALFCRFVLLQTIAKHYVVYGASPRARQKSLVDDSFSLFPLSRGAWPTIPRAAICFQRAPTQSHVRSPPLIRSFVFTQHLCDYSRIVCVKRVAAWLIVFNQSIRARRSRKFVTALLITRERRVTLAPAANVCGFCGATEISTAADDDDKRRRRRRCVGGDGCGGWVEKGRRSLRNMSLRARKLPRKRRAAATAGRHHSAPPVPPARRMLSAKRSPRSRFTSIRKARIVLQRR